METTFSAIEVIKNSWKLFLIHKHFYLKTTLLYGGISLVAGMIVGEKIDGLSDMVLQVISSVALWYGMFLLMKASLLVSSGKPITQDAFVLTPRLVISLILASLLVGIGSFIGFILLVIPGVIFALRAAFAQYIVIDQNEKPVSAIKKSIALTKGYFWSVFRLMFAMIVLCIISIFPLIFLGFIVTVPLSSIAFSLAYRKMQNAGGTSVV